MRDVKMKMKMMEKRYLNGAGGGYLYLCLSTSLPAIQLTTRVASVKPAVQTRISDAVAGIVYAMQPSNPTIDDKKNSPRAEVRRSPIRGAGTGIGGLGGLGGVQFLLAVRRSAARRLGVHRPR